MGINFEPCLPDSRLEVAGLAALSFALKNPQTVEAFIRAMIESSAALRAGFAMGASMPFGRDRGLSPAREFI